MTDEPTPTKPVPSSVPRDLTPSEIEWLRQNTQRSVERIRQYLRSTKTSQPSATAPKD